MPDKSPGFAGNGCRHRFFELDPVDPEACAEIDERIELGDVLSEHDEGEADAEIPVRDMTPGGDVGNRRTNLVEA